MAKFKRGINVISVVFKTVLALIILVGVASNILFFDNNAAPSFMGYTAYIMDSDEITGMELNSLIISKEKSLPDVQPGSVILFKDDAGIYALARVHNITEAESGKKFTIKNNMAVNGETTESHIVAKAIRFYPEVGSYIKFVTTQHGIIFMIILPLAILIFFLILGIKNDKKLKDDEFAKEFAQEYEPRKSEKLNTTPKSVPVTPHSEHPKRKPVSAENSPLYEPNKPQPEKPEFNEKKASVSKNFSEKPVSQNTQALRKEAKPVENTPVANVIKSGNQNKPSAKPERNFVDKDFDENQVNREIEKRVEEIKLSMHKQTAVESTKKAPVVSEPIPEFTADEILDQLEPKSESKPEAASVKPAPKAAAPKPKETTPTQQPKAPVKKPAPKSKLNANSFDDLLKVLDNEKKKLN